MTIGISAFRKCSWRPFRTPGSASVVLTLILHGSGKPMPTHTVRLPCQYMYLAAINKLNKFPTRYVMIDYTFYYKRNSNFIFLRRGVRDWSFNLGCWLSTLLKNIELYTVLLKQKNWKLIKHWYIVCYKIQFLYKICIMKPGFLNTDITIQYTKQYQMRTPTVAYISTFREFSYKNPNYIKISRIRTCKFMTN